MPNIGACLREKTHSESSESGIILFSWLVGGSQRELDRRSNLSFPPSREPNINFSAKTDYVEPTRSVCSFSFLDATRHSMLVEQRCLKCEHVGGCGGQRWRRRGLQERRWVGGEKEDKREGGALREKDERRRRTFKKDWGAASPHSTFLSMHLKERIRVCTHICTVSRESLYTPYVWKNTPFSFLYNVPFISSVSQTTQHVVSL